MIVTKHNVKTRTLEKIRKFAAELQKDFDADREKLESEKDYSTLYQIDPLHAASVRGLLQVQNFIDKHL